MSARGAEVGNFAEIKSATLGARSKQHHFSYLGDAQVGAGVNIGAGTITANYDGQRKHRTVIGDGAFIGSDTILRAPVTIGEGAVTGAGSVVTHDVAAHTTVLGVPARPHPATASARDGDPDPGLMGPIVELLIIGLLILLNGVFVAAEISLVTVRRSRLQQLIEEGHRGAQRVDRLISQAGPVPGGLAAGHHLRRLPRRGIRGCEHRPGTGATPGFPGLAGRPAAIIIVTLAVAFVTAIFGELIPKTLALAHAERYAILFARPDRDHGPRAGTGRLGARRHHRLVHAAHGCQHVRPRSHLS